MCDDFNDGNANGWYVSSGNWSVANGGYETRSGNASSSLTYLSASTSLNNRILVDVLDLNTGPYNNFQILYGFQNSTDFYFAGCWVAAKRWTIGQYHNGIWQSYITVTDPEITNGLWGAIELVINGNTVTLSCNGINRITYTFPAGIPDGKVGLGAVYSDVRFDNLCVERL